MTPYLKREILEILESFRIKLISGNDWNECIDGIPEQIHALHQQALAEKDREIAYLREQNQLHEDKSGKVINKLQILALIETVKEKDREIERLSQQERIDKEIAAQLAIIDPKGEAELKNRALEIISDDSPCQDIYKAFCDVTKEKDREIAEKDKKILDSEAMLSDMELLRADLAAKYQEVENHNQNWLKLMSYSIDQKTAIKGLEAQVRLKDSEIDQLRSDVLRHLSELDRLREQNARQEKVIESMGKKTNLGV